MTGPVPTAFCCLPEVPGQVAVIGLPLGVEGLEKFWMLAHELGHLSQHFGPRGAFGYGKDEAQADRWAACALIPAERVAQHGNASIDAFIAALSAHYGDIPPVPCPERDLAGRIATIRLGELERSA